MADHQGKDRQNQELLELSRQILDLTKAIHAETPRRPAAPLSATAAHPLATLDSLEARSFAA